MKVQFDVLSSDVALAQGLALATFSAEVRKAPPLITIRLALFLALLLTFGEIMGLMKVFPGEQRQALAWVFWPAITALFLLALHARAYRREIARWRERILQPFPIPHTLTISDQGLELESRYGASRYAWPALLALRALPEHFGLYFSAGIVMVVPFRAFSTDDDRQLFESTLRTRIRT
jgi:hypothetical protein